MAIYNVDEIIEMSHNKLNYTNVSGVKVLRRPKFKEQTYFYDPTR